MALFLGIGCFIGNTSSSFLQRYVCPQCIAKIGMIVGAITGITLLSLAVIFTLNIYAIILPVFLLFVCCGLTFPNILGMTLNLFTKNAGIVSAVMGTIQIGGVFLLSSLATALKTDTLFPLATLYVGMLLLNLGLFFVGSKKKQENWVKSLQSIGNEPPNFGKPTDTLSVGLDPAFHS